MLKAVFNDNLKGKLSNDDIKNIRQLVKRLDYNRVANYISKNKNKLINKIFNYCWAGIGYDIKSGIVNVDPLTSSIILTYDYGKDEFTLCTLEADESLHPADERIAIIIIDDIFNEDVDLLRYTEDEIKNLTDARIRRDLKNIVHDYLFKMFEFHFDDSIAMNVKIDIIKRLDYELKQYGISYHICGSEIFLSNFDYQFN